MNETELEKRKARAASETLVIAPTEGGFRVYNPAAITNLYMVSGIPDSPKCNCPDFEAHNSDPEWRCKHILAVLNRMEKQQRPPAPESPQAPMEKEGPPNESEPTEKKKARQARNGRSQMLIKRSVSPDGYINSLSVEFLNVIDQKSDDEIKQQAAKVMALQREIVDGFFKANGNKANNGNTTGQIPEKANSQGAPDQQAHGNASGPADNADGAVSAQLLNVAGMNTRGGWKLFINVQVNGVTTKLFGSKRELEDYIAAAGFASVADHISQGMMLNLPCRVITKRSQDGKYLNIERVLPLKPLEGKGR